MAHLWGLGFGCSVSGWSLRISRSIDWASRSNDHVHVVVSENKGTPI